MVQFLPKCKFTQWSIQCEIDKLEVNIITKKCEEGCIREIDLKYPE